jgi:hypothetical protein
MAALVLESERTARERDAPVLARVRQVLEWRSETPDPLCSLVAPESGAAEVGLARANGGVDALLAGTAWRDAPRFACAPAIGESDGLGGVALAVAAGRIATGRSRETLVVGLAKERGYAIVLGAP